MKDLRKKDSAELNKHLVSLYRKRFKLLLEKTSGAEFIKSHLLKLVKRDIARVLTLMTELNNKKV